MNDPRSTVRVLTCPNCGGAIALRAAGSSVSMVCEHCGTTLDTTRPDLAIIAKASVAMRRPEVPLGSRGEVRGTTWEVVGYLERSDGEAGWSEYLLFNPYEGYGFLVDDGWRFSLGRLIDRLPNHSGGSLTLDDKGYTRFGSGYDVRVTFVVGEFYWRVAEGERVKATDFVRPGFLLSCEENDQERTWTLLALLDRGEAEAAFGLAKRRPNYGGTPVPHEPSPYGNLMSEALIVGLVATLTLLFIMAIGSRVSPLTSSDLTVRLDGPATTRVIGPIDLPDRSAAVRIQAQASQLDNSWVDLDYSLVERRTQQNFDAYALSESYHGRDSDGDWQEGNTGTSTHLSSIPRGSYDLVVEATGHRWQQGGTSVVAEPSAWGTATPVDVPVTIIVERGGMFFGNIVLALLLLLLWPVALVLLHLGFEKRRMAPVATGE